MTKQKPCIQCGALIQITYELNDQASIASCNKKYCSVKCKRQYNRTHIMSKRTVELTCSICEKKYYKPMSQAITSKMCSRLCMKMLAKRNAEKKAAARRKCSSCSCFIHDSNQKGLCVKCYVVAANSITRKCEVCEADYSIRLSDAKRFCSRGCQWKAQSAGIVKLPTNGRCGYRYDLNDKNYYKSSLEADFARFCRFMNLTYLYEHQTFKIEINKRIAYYTPDFYLPDFDKYVEMKGNRKDGKYNANLLCVEELQKRGVNIEVKLMTEFYTEIKPLSIQNIEGLDYKRTKSLVELRENHKN
jgi:hypothetical protein